MSPAGGLANPVPVPLSKFAEFGEGWGGASFSLRYNQSMRQKRTAPKTMYSAGKLRGQPTPAEHLLWQKLRRNQVSGVAFRRQHAIGSYIVDFCSPSVKIVIELDGSQHMNQAKYDAERTAFLAERGYRVIRFWNNDVLNNLDAVLQVILDAVQQGLPGGENSSPGEPGE